MNIYLILLSGLVIFSAQVYKIGDKVNDFTLTSVTENKPVNLYDFASSKAVVLIFNSYSCPYSKVYDSRLVSIARESEKNNVKFLFINSQNSENEDLTEAMTSWSRNHNLILLKDSKKTVATAFGASKTPEAFVLKNINGNLILQYKGAIDDNPQTEKEVSVSYLKEAINASVTGNAVKVSEKRATGCIIK